MDDIFITFGLVALALFLTAEVKDERDPSKSRGYYNYSSDSLALAGQQVYEDAYKDAVRYHLEVIEPGNNMFGVQTAEEAAAVAASDAQHRHWLDTRKTFF